MAREHTPGPWRVTEDAETNIRAGSRLVARAFDVWERGPDPNVNQCVEGACEANAQLIASAPELLAALEGIAAVIEEWDGGENDYTLADLLIGTPAEGAMLAAIAKAKGTQ